MKNDSARQADKFRGYARTVVRHYLGSRRARLERLGGGLSNYVFEVKHPDGEFTVRISPDPARLDVFIKEQWCERAAREAGIPTAEILETGASVIPLPYLIARKVNGTSGDRHPAGSEIMKELGTLAAKINSIRTKGFGETFDWSQNELSRNKSFKDYLIHEYRYDDRVELLERSRLCPAGTIRALKKIRGELTSMRPRPVLNHGDLRLKNVIADKSGRIQAILDWEKATSNIAPHWELSIALHDLGVDESEQFLEGYGLGSERLIKIAPFIKAFNLLNYTDEITRSRDAKDKTALDRLRKRFAGVFDLYSLPR